MTSARIYLDHAATSPVRPEVAEAMLAAAEAAHFNPSSLHSEGRRARALLDDARDRVAAVFGATRKEIVFTASGTESDNAAILGAMAAAPSSARAVSTAVEHHAVLHAMDALREVGRTVSTIGVDERGRLDVAAFEAALDANACSSAMYANNETGTIFPIAELAAAARARGAIFHTDAVQAAPWLPLDVRALGVDLLSISAHKLGGPKGTGALYVRAGTRLEPIVHGGGQEFGLRSGTENLVGITGLATALELAARDRVDASARVGALRDRLERGLLDAVFDARRNGDDARLPNIANLSFAGVRSDELLAALDLEGIAVSAGSACTSGVLEPSHVLAAMGAEPRWSVGTIRLSLARSTTPAEVDRALEVIPRVVSALRGNRVARP